MMHHSLVSRLSFALAPSQWALLRDRTFVAFSKDTQKLGPFVSKQAGERLGGINRDHHQDANRVIAKLRLSIVL